MNIFGDKSNWLASTLIALGLHGGAMFLIVGQMKANVPERRETEISILTLPSQSVRTPQTVSRLQSSDPEIANQSEANDISVFEKLLPDKTKAETLSTINEAQIASIATADQVAALVDTVAERSEPFDNQADSLTPAQQLEQVEKTIPENAPQIPADAESVASTQTSQPVDQIETVATGSVDNNSKTIAPSQIPTQADTVSPQVTNVVDAPAFSLAEIINPPDEAIASSNDYSRNTAATAQYTGTEEVARNTAEAVADQAAQTAAMKTAATSIAPTSLEMQRQSRQQFEILANAPTTASKVQLSTPARPARIIASPRQSVNLSASRAALGTPVKTPTVQRTRQTPLRTRPTVVRQPARTEGARPVRPTVVAEIRRPRTTITTRSQNNVARKPTITQERIALLPKLENLVPEIERSRPPTREERLGKVRNFLIGQDVGNCFVALPSTIDNQQVGIYGFGRSKRFWPGFLKRLSQKTNIEIPAKLATITDAQCLVASFTKQASTYPNFSVSIALEQETIISGDFLEGQINNVNNRFLNLILVDDEGIAQRLNAYLFNKSGAPRFSLPVTSTSGPIATAQLLIAIVTDEELQSTAFYEPLPVTELLFDVEQELRDKGLGVDLAITAFTVK